ncbi:MAG TPA: hypothetical protein VMV07_19965 [Streptosporangiaceae bacterium]|nr:hypothetical protein [Streptosporangiaceae bacterium]
MGSPRVWSQTSDPGSWEFWARCDRVLKTGRSFARSFDQVRSAERRQAAGLPEDAGLPDAVPGTGLGVVRRARQQVSSGQAAEALAGGVPGAGLGGGAGG